ncbi:MAG: N-acetylmuramoyl-L-alanine amidase [Holosporales bacterium]|jgi:N-acetylmuramoyl-L-alanine amidase|nr:N-acetylmuramoyl-L-alanine amidase [Holosporales bacterium]
MKKLFLIFILLFNCYISNGLFAASDELNKTNNEILKNKIICIDAGHGLTSKKYNEKIAPTASETKPAFATGTRGSKYTEEELVLIVAKKLQTKLISMGATVIMTRENHETTLSNIERAKFANDAKADISIKLHADGVANKNARGMSVLVPSLKYVKAPNVVAESRKIAEIILKNCLATTGAHKRGITEHSDMTGLNWSTVPVILLEMGFMTNDVEDKLLSTDEYQNKVVDGIVNGVLEYYGLEKL